MVCKRCGRVLPLDAFSVKRGKPTEICRECYNARRGATYKKGDVVRHADGTLWQHNGSGMWRRYWSPDMIALLKREYATNTNRELATLLDVCEAQIRRKARALGLRKDAAYLHALSEDHILLAHIASKKKGNKGWIKKGEHLSPDTEFKPKKAKAR